MIGAILGADHRTAPNGHVARLSSLFAQMDHIEQYELADYEPALNARVAAISQWQGRRTPTSMPD